MLELLLQEPSSRAAAQPREYYLMAELRRAILWGIAGCPLIASVATYMMIFVRQRDLAELLILFSVLALGSLWFSQYLLPRIRVDEMGIRRRILWWWDQWPWDAFVNGQVRDDAGLYSYLDRARPWWRRRLQLGLLEESDAKAINELIRRVWVPPAVGPLPEGLELQFRWPDRRIIRLTPASIVIAQNSKEIIYRWDEVTSVELWRLTRDRSDFRELRLQLPDQELHLRRFLNQGQECMTWLGADSEAIAGFICLHVNPARIQDFSMHDAPASLEELNARQQRDIQKFTEQLKVMKWVVRCSWGTIAVIPVFMPWPGSLFMVAMYSMLGVAMHWMYWDAVRKYQKRLEEFEIQRRALAEDAAAGADVSLEVAG